MPVSWNGSGTTLVLSMPSLDGHAPAVCDFRSLRVAVKKYWIIFSIYSIYEHLQFHPSNVGGPCLLML